MVFKKVWYQIMLFFFYYGMSYFKLKYKNIINFLYINWLDSNRFRKLLKCELFRHEDAQAWREIFPKKIEDIKNKLFIPTSTEFNIALRGQLVKITV